MKLDMNLQDMFRRKLREDLEEQKRQMIEAAVEEYRETLDDTLSDVVDRFVENIHCSICSKFDPEIMRQSLEFRVVLGDEFYASRDTAKGSEDKQQE